MRHFIWMMIGCLLPLIVLLVLVPALGPDSRWLYLVAALAMLGCHLFMLGGHKHGYKEEDHLKGGHHGTP